MVENPSNPRICLEVGKLMKQFGQLQRAGELYESAQRIHVADGTLETRQGVKLFIDGSVVKKALGNLEGALQDLLEAERILSSIGCLETTADGATVLKAIGGIKQGKGDLDGALEQYKEAVQIYRLVEDPAREANTLISIANIKNGKGDLA